MSDLASMGIARDLRGMALVEAMDASEAFNREFEAVMRRRIAACDPMLDRMEGETLENSSTR
jgi:hypothetical protein